MEKKIVILIAIMMFFCGVGVGVSIVTVANSNGQTANTVVGSWVVHYSMRDVVVEFRADGTGTWQFGQPLNFTWQRTGDGFTSSAYLEDLGQQDFSGELTEDGKRLVIKGFGDGTFMPGSTTVFDRL